MIDETVFRDTWALLCDRFNRAPSAPLMQAYYSSLTDKLTTEQFKVAAQRIFEQREFFPRPADFLPDAETETAQIAAEALGQWDHFHALMRGFPHYDRMTDETKRLVRTLGGETALRNSPIDSIPFVRKEFLRLYGDMAAAVKRERESGEEIGGGPRLLA